VMKEIFIYEPDPDRLAFLKRKLDPGFSVYGTQSIDRIYKLLDQKLLKTVILNLDASDQSTLKDIINEIQSRNQESFLIGLTNNKTKETLKEWASSNLTVIEYNHTGIDELAILLKYNLEREVLGSEDEHAGEYTGFIGDSPEISHILNQISVIKDSDVNIFITGETGSGKTELARFIHKHSQRSGLPFMHINCAAIPDNLLESELFGYKKGAFTGAVSDRPGKFKAADKGTIFLDEIAEIPSHLQAKLLKVLDEKNYYPVGGTTPLNVEGRIIAATNKNLVQAVKAKKFREDLYFRLNTIEINIPPLREHPEDIPVLFDYFVHDFVKSNKTPMPEINPAVYDILKQYTWDGNVRELQNIVNSILYSKPASIGISHLKPEIFATPRAKRINSAIHFESMEKVKKDYAKYVYEMVEKNKSRAAQILKVDVKTIRKLLDSR